jgi:hypothetical protein
MTISYKRLPNAGKTFLVYLVIRLFVVLNAVLIIKYILLNASVTNHVVIELLLGIRMYASAQ